MNPIVGIGELLWDVFPDGRKVAGGAPFNFTFHCKQLGHDAVMVSRVGDDDLGRELREEVRRLGLSDEFIQTDYEHPTGTVRVSVDANGQPSYTITEDVAWDFIGWDDSSTKLAARCDAIAFGTLAWRRSGSELIRDSWLGSALTSEFITLIVFDINLRSTHWTLDGIKDGILQCEWVKLSDEEADRLAQIVGTPLDDYESLFAALDEMAKPNPKRMIVTSGPRGSKVFGGHYPASETFGEPGVSAKVMDTVGAGDAFTAAMVCLHLEGRPLRDCARFANHYAARVCEQQGGTPRIDRADVERAAFG